MFGKKEIHHYIPTPSGPSKMDVDVRVGPTTITENRAPTDDSIRLAKEYEEKIRKSVMAAYASKNNLLDGTFVILHDMAMWEIAIHYVFKLNGHTLEGCARMSIFDLEKSDNMIRTAGEALQKSVIEKIAENFVMFNFLYEHANELLTRVRSTNQGK